MRTGTSGDHGSGDYVIAFSTAPGGNSDVVGVLLCLLSAVVYSISLVLQKRVVGRMPAVHVTWPACTAGVSSGLNSTSASVKSNQSPVA